MITKSLKILLILIAAMAVGTPAGWAKKTAYGYLIAYSYRDQVVYYTPIFTQRVAGASYSDEEYVAHTGTILKLESDFRSFLEQRYTINSANFTISARAAFKTQEIAQTRLNEENRTFTFRGFQMIEVPNYSP